MTENDVSLTNKFRVLIADDFQETRRSIRLMLSMNPDVTVVAIAKDGAQAVEMAAEQHPDILVMDINMPKVSGLEAYKRISEIQPNTGCVIITGERGTGPLDEAITLGVYEYLLKPFNIEELNSAVNRIGALLLQKRAVLADEYEKLQKSETTLKSLAEEYSRTRRSDDEALRVFETLANNSGCELRWLRTLAMQYVIRQEWGKLKALAQRLENQGEPTESQTN